MKKLLLTIIVGITAITMAACEDTEANVASHNLSKEADTFKVERRVVFFNGITDKYLLTIEGRCSIEHEENQLEVTCKISEEGYKKHFLGLSDNVSYFVEQTDANNVDPFHYKVIFRPESIVPDIDLQTSNE